MLSEMWFSQSLEIMEESLHISPPVRANPLTKLQLRTSLPTNLKVVELGESHPTNLQEEENLRMGEVPEVSFSR